MKKQITPLLIVVGTCILLVGGCTENRKKDQAVSTAPTPAAPASQSSSLPTAAAGPEKIVLKASSGNVTFTHHKHQQAGIACTVCHANSIGKIANLNMKWGHDTCKGCHTSKGAGPRACNDCHKK
jgi:hypothetical protein